MTLVDVLFAVFDKFNHPINQFDIEIFTLIFEQISVKHNRFLFIIMSITFIYHSTNSSRRAYEFLGIKLDSKLTFTPMVDFLLTVSNRLFELGKRYVVGGLHHSVPLVIKQADEYKAGIESRYIEYPTPLCNCYLTISSFFPELFNT
ncbi:hypothetical protein BpHYR1_020520 [Brachionus plicatilis]|uniref:Uncharacterized protein n=1 Tax=Brachionus plicatilis TaxID=10195 RepID=A0A3M7RM37_BRAPC|nr:hypothetical protein BpHYR1_020520 [Brachionus plicatilis]